LCIQLGDTKTAQYRIRAAYRVAKDLLIEEKHLDGLDLLKDAAEEFRLDELKAEITSAIENIQNKQGESQTESSRSKPLTESQIHRVMTERFDEDELRTLCFYLDVDYDVLRGEGKVSKARELLLYLKRRGRIGEVVDIGKELRPDISWENTSKATIETASNLQSGEEDHMLVEIFAIPVLLKAVDFLFDEAKNILEERRIARQNPNLQVTDPPDIPLIDQEKDITRLLHLKN
jgi:hypothetical protein